MTETVTELLLFVFGTCVIAANLLRYERTRRKRPIEAFLLLIGLGALVALLFTGCAAARPPEPAIAEEIGYGTCVIVATEGNSEEVTMTEQLVAALSEGAPLHPDLFPPRVRGAVRLAMREFEVFGRDDYKVLVDRFLAGCKAALDDAR